MQNFPGRGGGGVQWLKIPLPMQGTQAQSLVGELGPHRAQGLGTVTTHATTGEAAAQDPSPEATKSMSKI